MNDDLVAKKFAYYSRKLADSSELDEEDRFPLMLSPGILTPTVSATANKPTARAQPAPGKHTDNTLPSFPSTVMSFQMLKKVWTSTVQAADKSSVLTICDVMKSPEQL